MTTNGETGGERVHVFGETPESLSEHVAAWGMPRFRARQVLEWVYQRGVIDPALMTNLSKADRALLSERLLFLSGCVVRHQRATDGVQKLLVSWPARQQTGREVGPESGGVRLPVSGVVDDGAMQTECVMIPSENESGGVRKTACISSQAGCPVGCRFCASGLEGLEANLSTGQIVEQVWQLSRMEGVGRISNVVFMGMGEPLSNLAAVTSAIRTLAADWGLGIGARKITVSTVGLPAQIRRLVSLELPITLAISLHAPNDELRRRLIPWAEYVTVEQLLDAGRFYFDQTGREVTLEYILLGGENDREEHARELVVVAKRLRSNVNLIRYNEVEGLPFKRPAKADVLRFQEVLRDAGVNVHIRASRGRDIAAACGQLRYESRGGVSS
ncbi:23S rRNA (adenine(2503)-C(2))-methyltransferase RlmN [Mucisphaera calidilacus]|uniref:Probable dual-specificity RNA methyltransferase RlmN n=1 Tax=Mucisphaera calidilacus TaxID=2527982 RepID=A0A518BYJ8_9BACT|nr:23S rRNA (adenine(2503)-C(2))-methyltransferase RlmN [Mucisphaera calidilacus]QDU72053.1 putative dual-specificity RNA methyltransferase RlmN [Mucisphaera calidilacus]